MIDKKAAKAVDQAIKVLNKYILESDKISNERKDQVNNVLEVLGERLFTAPASTKTAMHSAYPGGLIVHSLAVTRRIFDLCGAFEVSEEDVPHDSKVIVGLFHDIGKIGTYDGIPQYMPEESEWHRTKLGQIYNYNKNLDDALTHAQRSARLLGQCGLILTDQEYASILIHDGIYIETNKSREAMYTKIKLARIAHFADSWVALQEDI